MVLGNGKNVSLNITQTLIGIILDDPDMRAVLERALGEAQAFPGPADRPYKGGTGMSRLSTIQEKITSIFQAMLGKDEPDLAEVASKVASLHANAKVNNAMLLKAGFALEDALKDKGLDIPPEFYKRLRSFMVKVVEFYDKRRAQAEELVELKERYYRATFEASQSGMAVVDAKGRFWGVNDRVTQLLGYSKDEVLNPGFSWTNLLSEEGLKRVREEIKELIETGKPQRTENILTGKDGRKIPVIISYAKLPRQPDFETDRIILDILDITELKEAQEKLKELVEAQQQTIKELSTPIIPIWLGVLGVPLIGSFDSQRMHDLSERLLDSVASGKPKYAILDLSGLAHVDSQVISEIVKLINAVKLLGTRTLLSGIGPSVAQSLVRIGANLEGIPTYSSLEQALRSIIGGFKPTALAGEERRG